MKVLIVGKNSFIGKNFFFSVNFADFISHTEINNVNFNHYDTVVNLSINPKHKNLKYNEENDTDLLVANKCAKSNCHFVMLSTRRVYGCSNDLKVYNETSSINPADFYSENKFITEEKIRKEHSNYTILRGSNIFGNEYGRNSFMGFCLTQLKNNNEIVFNISENVIRDFISVSEVSKVLKKVCEKKITGTFNLSSNSGLKISEIPKYLIQGKGEGQFRAIGNLFDQFVLDNTLLSNAFDLTIKKNYENEIIQLGKNLCKI